jgi:phage terminase small subunit
MDQDELFPGNRIEREVRVINASDDRYRIFVSAYLGNGMNATQAAIAAGYSEATAYSQGSRLLKRPEIAAMIAAGSRQAVEKLDYSAERTLEEIARIAFFDVRAIMNADGSVKPITQLDDNAAAAIAGMDVTEITIGKGDDAVAGVVKKLKFAPKAVALDMLMRYHSQYRDKLEVGGSVTLISHIPRPDHAAREALRFANATQLEG